MLSRKLERTQTITSKHEAALPIVREKLGEDDRHVTLFEMTGKQRKAHEQAEQVRENHPLVTEMRHEAGDASTGLESGKRNLVEGDCHQTGERHNQNVAMKQRDAQQGQPKQNEIDWDTEHRRTLPGRCPAQDIPAAGRYDASRMTA